MELNHNKPLNKYHVLLAFILLAATIIQLRYFNMNTAIWHDEGEYLATMKAIATHLPYDINPQRPPLFPLLGGLLFKLFNSELFIRILLLLIPSILSIYFAYRLTSLLYNKRIALMTAAMMSVFYMQIFYTARVLVDVPLMLLTSLNLIYFWKGHIINDSRKHMILFGLLLGISFLTKFTAALTGIAVLFYLLITEKLKFLKNKNMWYGFFAFLVVFVPYIIWSKITFNRYFAFFLATHVLSQPAQTTTLPIAWPMLQFFYIFPKLIFFIIFLIGCLTFVDLVLGFDLILKEKENKLKPDLLVILYLLIFFGYFVFIERPQNFATDRWFLPASVFMFMIIAKGFDFLYLNIWKTSKSKIVAITAVAIILLLGSYVQLGQADMLMKEKKDTYRLVREAALWMKENSKSSDVIISASSPETAYYSERRTVGFGYEKDFIKEKIIELKPKFYVLSIFEQQPDYAVQILADYKDKLIPVKSYTLSPNDKPAMVIFTFKDYNFVESNETKP